MDTFIQDASKGSPILAYGTKGSSPKSLAVKILIAAAILLGVFLLTLIGTFAFGSAIMPSKPLFEIAINPRDAARSLNGALITELPGPWRTALESESRLPAILGIAQTKDGGIAPFAIISKSASVSVQEGFTETTSGLISYISGPNIETGKKPYRSIMKLLGLKRRHDVSWMIDQQLLSAISGSISSNNSDDRSVFGTLSGTDGEILLPSESVSGENREAAFFVILGNRNEQDRVLSSSLRSQGLNILEARDPNGLTLSGSGSLRGSWLELSDTERPEIAVAAGHSTATPFILPDSDLVATIGSAASGTEKELVIENAWKQTSGEADVWKSSCSGTIRFAIHGEALQNLLLSFKTPSSWREKIQSFAISTDGKRNIFCVNK